MYKSWNDSIELISMCAVTGLPLLIAHQRWLTLAILLTRGMGVGGIPGHILRIKLLELSGFTSSLPLHLSQCIALANLHVSFWH